LTDEAGVIIVDELQSDHSRSWSYSPLGEVLDSHADHVWLFILPEEVDVFVVCESHADHALCGGTTSLGLALELELCFRSVSVHCVQDASTDEAVDIGGFLADDFIDEPGVEDVLLSDHCAHACGSLAIEAVGY